MSSEILLQLSNIFFSVVWCIAEGQQANVYNSFGQINLWIKYFSVNAVYDMPEPEL